MLKKINIYSDKDVLYITDDEKKAEKINKIIRKIICDMALASTKFHLIKI